MADSEDLKLLESGSKDLTSCDFREADLTERDLSRVNLTGSHLEKANLRGANLQHANLTRSRTVQANFSDANLEGAVLGKPLVAVNFSGADLRKAKFTGILQKVTFDNADLRGADFTGCTINEGCSFAGAKYDETTNFTGVKTLRSIAREAPFSGYQFAREGLIRGSVPSSQSESDIESSPAIDFPDPQETDAGLEQPKRVISSRLLSAPKQSLQLTEGLSARIAAEITSLSEHIPNDPEALDTQQRYVTLLTHILAELQTVAVLLGEIASQPEANIKTKAETASGILSGLGDVISTWASENGQHTIKYGLNVGLLGAGALFLSSCGVATATAFPVLAVLMCGKEVAGVLTSGKKE